MNRNFAMGCVYIALATLIFSTMEVMLKLPAVSGAFHPMQITLERFLVGGLCLIPIAARTLKKKGLTLTGMDLAYFALTGLVVTPLSMVLYQLAITHGQANIVAVIFSGNPIFVTVLACLILHEAIRWNNILALVFEILGIVAIINPFGSGEISLTSIGLAIGAALFFALYAVMGKRKTKKFGSIVVTCCSFLFGSLELLALLLLGRLSVGQQLYEELGLDIFCDVPFLQGINGTTLPYFLCICVVNSAAGYVCHMLAIEKTSATYGSLVFFFKPIIAPIIALLVLGEAITGPIATGIGCLLVSSLLSILPELYRAKKRKIHAELAETPPKTGA